MLKTECVILLGFSVVMATAQGTFQNLNFEQAQISGVPPQSVPISQALPHWQVSENGTPATQILYDAINLNLWGVSIQDGKINVFSPSPHISGKYSLFF